MIAAVSSHCYKVRQWNQKNTTINSAASSNARWTFVAVSTSIRAWIDIKRILNFLIV